MLNKTWKKQNLCNFLGQGWRTYYSKLKSLIHAAINKNGPKLKMLLHVQSIAEAESTTNPPKNVDALYNFVGQKSIVQFFL